MQDKTPGCDGISANWYKCVWEQKKDILHNAYMYAIEQGALHPSARRGVICLIPKKDGNSL